MLAVTHLVYRKQNHGLKLIHTQMVVNVFNVHF